MSETVDRPDVRYCAESPLARPATFIRAVLANAGHAVPAGWLLFRSGLRARHRRSWLAALWLIVPGLATASICVAIRAGHLVTLKPTLLPYPVFVLSGMFLWQGFVDGVTVPQAQLTANRGLLTRTPIVHETVLIAVLCELALNLTVRLALLAVALVLIGVPTVPGWVFVPIGAAALVMLGLALGLFLAPFGTLYEDVGRIVAIGTTFALLLTPVLYPVPARGLFWLSPPTPLIEGVRAWLVGGRPDPICYAIAAVAAVGAALGWLWYRLAQPHLTARAG